MLVTNKDGSQSVKTVERELGMNAKDMADIKARLREQGIDGDYNVDLYGQADNRDQQARNPNAKPVNIFISSSLNFSYGYPNLSRGRWPAVIAMAHGKPGSRRANNHLNRPKVVKPIDLIALSLSSICLPLLL